MIIKLNAHFHPIFKNTTYPALVLVLFLGLGLASAKAQQNEPVQEVAPVQADVEEASPSALALSHLAELKITMEAKNKELIALRKRQTEPGADPELDTEINRLMHELEVVRRSFEQIATGGVSLDVFNEEAKPQDWREELATVVKPLLKNLNDLTEKPRKKENLKQTINSQRSAAQAAERAIEGIDLLLADEASKPLVKQLSDVKEKWVRLKADAERQQQLAEFELENLDQGGHWFRAFSSSVSRFARERGLTLLLALVVSLSVWGFFRGLRWVFERNGKSKRSHRTGYRIVKYSQRLITVLLIILSILFVFFIRGDILLLALMSLLLFAAALGLRNLLPQFVNESRLLLNIGNVRESEHLMYNGIPWRVASINVFTKLINPEIRGTVRLPISALKDMVSRPIVSEKWFPSSIGDWVLDGDRLYEVIEQTPNAVELQSAQGTNKLVPTADYYAAGFVNLTRSKRIRIVSHFGVDYQLQSIALDEVPVKLQAEIQSELKAADLGTSSIETRVEFEQAGSSSLDYIIIVQVGSAAAKHYYRIQRLIQQACVAVCNVQGWIIPFPQLTVHTGK